MLLATAYLALAAIIFWTVWPTMKAHNFAEHREAFRKSFFLWLLSFLPVAFAFFLSGTSTSPSNAGGDTVAGDPFAPSEQFVYACTFIAPALYVFVDALLTFIGDRDHDRIDRFRSTLKHYDRVLLPSLLVLLTSIVLFVGVKIDSESFRKTSFFIFASDKSILVYAISILYWYCVNLIETPPRRDYVTTTTEQTESVLDAAARRMGLKKNG